MNINELLIRQKNNPKIAIKHGKNKITYKNWYIRAIDLSDKINKSGLTESKNIAIFLPNSINYAIAYFAILFSGKTIIPIGIQSKIPEIINMLKYCEIDLIISSIKYENILNEILGYNHKIAILYIENKKIKIFNDQKSFVEKSDTLKKVPVEDEVAIMLHTSGTTNNPKRVMLTHKNLINSIESNIALLKLTDNDKCLITASMQFVSGNTSQFLTHIYLGASIVILDGVFLPKLFFQTVQEEKITNFSCVPSVLLMILEYHYTDNYDIKSLRYICFGGSSMPVDKLELLINKFKTIGFVQVYGQTETYPRATALMPEDSLKKIGSVGQVCPNVHLKIVDENGNDINNEIGEIIIRGNIMKGYYKQDEITDEIIINDWFYTGDLGYRDDEGYLYLTGRKKNIIISGGINIYPEEIEDILVIHPNVKEARVYGEKHPLLIEIPIAQVILSDYTSEQELRNYCYEKLSNYKVPEKIYFVNEIKKTESGKISRK